MKFWYSVPLGLLFVCLSIASQAQILIGQSAGFMYLDAVNAKGGIGGQKIELISMDDKFDPKLADENARIAKTDPEAVMVIGSGTAVVDCIRAIKAAGGTPQGVIVTQVLPQSYGFPLVKEAADLARPKNITDVSPAMLEGFAAAKVLVEALRQASPKITRDRIQTALEGLHKFDIGGMDISYGLDDRTGLDFADLSIIGENGKFSR